MVNKQNSPCYELWRAMIKRCYYPKCNGYENYGGRGIKVCKRWLGRGGYKRFMLDMGQRPSANHTLDRIKTNGNYTRKNCRWATREEQASNKRNNIFIVYKGSRMTVSKLARIVNLPKDMLTLRIKRWTHLTIEQIIAVPIFTTPGSKQVLHIPTNEKYASIKEAAKVHNLTYAALKQRIANKSPLNEFEIIKHGS